MLGFVYETKGKERFYPQMFSCVLSVCTDFCRCTFVFPHPLPAATLREEEEEEEEVLIRRRTGTGSRLMKKATSATPRRPPPPTSAKLVHN